MEGQQRQKALERRDCGTSWGGGPDSGKPFRYLHGLRSAKRRSGAEKRQDVRSHGSSEQVSDPRIAFVPLTVSAPRRRTFDSRTPGTHSTFRSLPEKQGLLPPYILRKSLPVV